MLNKFSNSVKITKNGAQQREIWRPEIGPAARVFQKNPSSKVGDEPDWGGSPTLAWRRVSLTPSSVWPPVSSIVTVIL
jgi:hypothetical protein